MYFILMLRLIKSGLDSVISISVLLHLFLAYSLYIIVSLPPTLYHGGKLMTIKPRPSGEVVRVGVNLKTILLPGSLSPRTSEEETMATLSVGVVKAKKFYAFIVVEDSASPLQSLLRYELTLKDVTSMAECGFLKLVISMLTSVRSGLSIATKESKSSLRSAPISHLI